MQGIKALRSFTYEHVRNDLIDESEWIPNFAIASQPCLSYHAHSLEAVRIRESSETWFFRVAMLLDRASSHGVNVVDWDKPAYPRLRTVDIGPQLVYPPSPGNYDRHVKALVKQLGGVERLRITLSSDEGGEELFLSALARAIAFYNPSLKTVELVEWDPLRGWYPSEFPMLQRMYAERGLTLSSVPGEVKDFHSAEPVVMDEETEAEAGWVLITDAGVAASPPEI